FAASNNKRVVLNCNVMGGKTMSGLKSSYEIAMEKMTKMGLEDNQNLTDDQKAQIAEIRSMYTAKIAEKKILLKNEPQLPDEISFLEREQERKIEEVYTLSRKG
ncbi:MAG: hypothetical protein WCQ99_08960, partial [Pseudomonadota bacterium]